MGDEWTYCPKCGAIPANEECSCGCFRRCIIDSKWGINQEAKDALIYKSVYGVIPYRESIKLWRELLTPFIEEVVSKNPEFDKECYQKVLDQENSWAKKQDWISGKMDQYTAKHPSTPKITCPYCNSTNTKKLSSLSRAFSAGFFGLGSSKIGKQWHCNRCGSDF